MPGYSLPSPGERAKHLGRNVAWLIANRLVRIVTGVLILGAIGRYLGPEGFGQLNFAIGLATIFSAVASLGFEGIVVRDLVREPHRTEEILGTAFRLRLGGGVLAIAAVAIAAGIGGDRNVLVLAVIVALSFLPGALDVAELWFQKNVDARSTFLPRTFATLAVAGVRGGLILAQAPIEMFAFSQVLEAALGALGLLVVYRRRGGRFAKWKWSGALAWRILGDSWPLILSGILIALYSRTEQILVKALLGHYVLGVYYAAIRITETWVFLPAVILATIYPALVARRERNHQSDFQQQLQTMYDLLTGLGYVIAIVVSATAFVAVPLVFGEAYRAAVPVLIIQAWTAPILFSGAARAQIFLMENLTIYHTWSAVIGIGANVGLALWWMPIFGAEGAAFAALVSAWISACGTSFLFPRLRSNAHLQTAAFLLPFRLPQFVRALHGHFVTRAPLP